MNPIIQVKESTVIVLEPIKCYKCGIVFGVTGEGDEQTTIADTTGRE